MTKLAATTFHAGRILTESDLESFKECCPICHFTGFRQPTLKLQTEPLVSLLKCPICKGISASRMPTQAALTNYYAKYYDRYSSELITFSHPERLAKRIVKHTSFLSTIDTISILDFGGGDGTIAKLIAEQLISYRPETHVKIVVVDYGSHRCNVNNAQISIRHIEDLNQLEGFFDVIVASASLEHIPAFRQTFDRLLDHASERAIFYARTPYMTPIAQLFPIDMTYPAHVHDIGAQTWQWLSSNAKQKISPLKSRPSIIETTLSTNAIRTFIAFALKAPASMMAAVGLPAFWPFYGGWEVIWRIHGSHRA